MFAEFMRSSMAHSQNQIVPTNQADPKTETHIIDSSPLIISERLNGENYALWAVLMKAAISGRGMIAHITGVPPRLAKIDPAFERWQQEDHCVFTWLTQNVKQRLVSRISQYPRAREIWKSLKITYASGGDKIQVYDLYIKVITIKQRDESLEDLQMRLNDTWISIDRRHPNPMKYVEDIDIYNTEKQEHRLFQLLVALNSKYESIKKEKNRATPLSGNRACHSLAKRRQI